MKEAPRQFKTLDALRGFAAVFVVMQHFSWFFLAHRPPHLFLAVDLFFALSGFVLSYAYQDKLDNGFSTFSFLGARLIRLWPLYIVGLLLGLVAMPPFSLFNHIRGHERAFAFLSELFFIPVWNSNMDATMYPLNGPFWSLTLELFMNCIHASLLRRRSNLVLVLICLLSGGALIHSFLKFGFFESGWSRRGILQIGVPRVMFSYVLGMLLFRAWRARVAVLKMPAVVPCIALAILFTARTPENLEGPFLAVALLLLMPAILLCSSYNEPPPALEHTFTLLGVTSYAVYVLHFPLGFLFIRYWSKVAGHSMLGRAPWSGAIFLAIVIPMAIFLDKFYDLPVRKRLRAYFHV